MTEALTDSETPDAIVKSITLKAPLDRVWRAIATADEFGQWFGMRFDGPFQPGPITGVIYPTVVDNEIAKWQEPHKGTPFSFVIERIEPQSLFVFRWHPYAMDKDYDYSVEPMTLITFALAPVDDGVHLTITESGFHQIPAARRAQAFKADEGGWQAQLRLIAAWLAR